MSALESACESAVGGSLQFEAISQTHRSKKEFEQCGFSRI
jgi:hypothetical protein